MLKLGIQAIKIVPLPKLREKMNTTILATLGLTLGIMLLAFAGIAVKLIFKKDGKFSGTCASQNPALNSEGEPCGLCGAMPSEQCNNPSK